MKFYVRQLEMGFVVVFERGDEVKEWAAQNWEEAMGRVFKHLSGKFILEILVHESQRDTPDSDT